MADEDAARMWAERAVEFYAGRVKMNLLEQGKLERLLASRFRALREDGRNADEWVPAANEILDGWEADGRPKGPRFGAFAGRNVIEKRRIF